MALTKISNNSLSAISSLPASIPTGALTLLSTQTASSSASISFTSGIDSTYSSYIFKFIDINPATDDVIFGFNLSIDNGSNYNVTKTTTSFRAQNREDDTGSQLAYRTAEDLAQSTSDQKLGQALGNENDENLAGSLQLFNPSSSVFVKHFISTINEYQPANRTNNQFIAGYANTTSAIDAVQFKMSSGNFDGIIKMYGVS